MNNSTTIYRKKCKKLVNNIILNKEEDSGCITCENTLISYK